MSELECLAEWDMTANHEAIRLGQKIRNMRDYKCQQVCIGDHRVGNNSAQNQRIYKLESALGPIGFAIQ